MELLDRVGMSNCKPISTLIPANSPLSLYDGQLLEDPMECRSIVRAL